MITKNIRLNSIEDVCKFIDKNKVKVIGIVWCGGLSYERFELVYQ